MIYHANFFLWLHLEWLRFLALPIMVYLTTPLTLQGFWVPAFFSFIAFWKYGKHVSWKNWQSLLLVESVCILGAWESLRWTSFGLHIFDMGILIYPIIAWIRPSIPLPIFYGLSFITEVSGDSWADLWRTHFAPNWFFGIGGAGFHDGVFVAPLETLVACIAVRYVLLGLSHLLGRTILGEFRDEG